MCQQGAGEAAWYHRTRYPELYKEEKVERQPYQLEMKLMLPEDIEKEEKAKAVVELILRQARETTW